jgi:tetratricopeptide (TPR) repeat protein/O-antigen ligase
VGGALRHLNVRLLIWQSVAFLLLSYFSLIGGSQSGVWFYSLRRLSVVILALFVGVWLFFWLRRGAPFPHTRLDFAWLLFVSAQALATVLSLDSRRSLSFLALTLVYWLVFYVIVDLLRGFRSHDLLVGGLILTGVVLIVFGAIELANWYRAWWEIGGWQRPIPPVTVRLQSLAPHANMLAAYLNVLLPFGVAAWLKVRQHVARAVLGLWSLAVLALLVFTSSRGGWIGTGIAVFVFVFLTALDNWFWVDTQWARLRRRPVCFGLLGVVFVGLLLIVGAVLLRQAKHPTHGPLLDSRQRLWAPVWATFYQRPIVGAGLGAYATQFLRIWSVPPRTLYSHAHSFLFNTLIESGLLGLLALAAMGVAVGFSIGSRWRCANPGSRLWLTAAAAALTATGVHSLFETPQTIAGFALLMVLVLAIVESRPWPYKRRAWIERGGRLALGLLWVVFIVALLANLFGYGTYARGIRLANWLQYDAAAPLLDQVAARDPKLASNWFQMAYVHAMIGLRDDDPDRLQRAVDGYRAGLDLEPSLAAHWGNLGVLLWRMEDEVGAREALQQAVERAPQGAVYLLTLAAFEEDMGNPSRALVLYERGLEQRSAWVDSFFFRATPLRAMARERWLAEHPEPADPLRACWEMMRGHDQALCFLAVRDLDHAGPLGDLGATGLTVEDWVWAEQELRVAAWAAEQSDSDRVALLYFALGDVLAWQGDTIGAVGAYERVLGTSDQVGLSGSTAGYTWSVFNREAILDRFLPGVVRVSVTDERAGRLLQLGAWYEELGQTEDAVRTYRSLLEAVPDMAEAEERLSALQ